MKKIMTYEDRKKWILDHESDYLVLGKETADKYRNRLIKVWEEGMGCKYTPEAFDKWKVTLEDRNFKTIEERYQENLKMSKDINEFLNDEIIMKEKQFFNKEEVNGVDISKALDEIRFNHNNEVHMYLFIGDGEVLDKYCIQGAMGFVKNGNRDELLWMKDRALELNAGVYDVHNHPYSFSASPSESDFDSAKSIKKLWDYFGIKYLDWGVVTEWDYYSYKKNKPSD